MAVQPARRFTVCVIHCAEVEKAQKTITAAQIANLFRLIMARRCFKESAAAGRRTDRPPMRSYPRKCWWARRSESQLGYPRKDWRARRIAGERKLCCQR